MSRARRLLLVLLIIAPCIGCDQITKSIATDRLVPGSPPISYLGDTIRIQYARNPGAFLSLGADLPEGVRFWLFTAVAFVIIFGIVAIIAFRSDLRTWDLVAFALLLSGAIGNLIDRLVNGGWVVDFLNLGIGRLRTGIFNVADVAIMAGLAMLLLGGVIAKRLDKNSAEVAEPGDEVAEPSDEVAERSDEVAEDSAPGESLEV